jgi:hypothetical protein
MATRIVAVVVGGRGEQGEIVGAGLEAREPSSTRTSPGWPPVHQSWRFPDQAGPNPDMPWGLTLPSFTKDFLDEVLALDAGDSGGGSRARRSRTRSPASFHPAAAPGPGLARDTSRGRRPAGAAARRRGPRGMSDCGISSRLATSASFTSIAAPPGRASLANSGVSPRTMPLRVEPSFIEKMWRR